MIILIYIILNIIGLVLGIYAIKTGLEFNNKNTTRETRVYLTPSEINILYNDVRIVNRAIAATLLDLYRRGNIDIREFKRESRNKSIADYVVEYEFSYINGNNLKDHEIHFLNTIFEEDITNNTDKITLEDKHNESFLNKMEEWLIRIYKNLDALNPKSSDNLEESKKLRNIGFILLIISAFSLLNKSNFGLISLIMAFPAFLVSLNLKVELSSEGKFIKNNLEELEASIKNKEASDLSEDELIKAIAIGIPMDSLIPAYEKSADFKSIDIMTKSLNEYGGSNFDDAINRAFMGFTKKTKSNDLETNLLKGLSFS